MKEGAVSRSAFTHAPHRRRRNALQAGLGAMGMCVEGFGDGCGQTIPPPAASLFPTSLFRRCSGTPNISDISVSLSVLFCTAYFILLWKAAVLCGGYSVLSIVNYEKEPSMHNKIVVVPSPA